MRRAESRAEQQRGEENGEGERGGKLNRGEERVGVEERREEKRRCIDWSVSSVL